MGHLCFLRIWGLWGLLLCAADAHTDGSKITPKVTEIIPKYGSINGATRLTIKGEGFSQANQFNYGVDDAELGNSVQLVSSFQSITCDVEKDASHSTQITCYTRPMPEDSYTVRVSVDGVPITENNTCKGHLDSWACSFNAKSFRTPTIRSITPLSGTPGSLITIQGRIFTDVYGSNTALSSNGKNVRILRVYIGGMPCELLLPRSDNLYGLKLDHSNGDMGSMTCKMTGTYIGHHNVSFILDSDYGRSFPEKMTYFISSLNKISMFQTYAEVTLISPSHGSTQGGTTLTIRGSFFDQTDFPVRVLVGGQACDILNVTENRILCKTPPKPHVLKSVYPGGRGLKLEVWSNTQPVHLEEILEYNETTPGYMGASWVDSASYIWPVEQDKFVARLSGFLVAPDSDVYRFYIKGDDRYAIYFSQTGLPEDKVKIAYHSANANSYFSSPTQKSDDIYLQKGKEYYIEILLQEYRLSAFVDVGLYQYTNVYTEQQTGDAVNEEQVIKSQSTVIQEVQIITLENWETANATNEVQKITVTSPCIEADSCSLYQYRLIYKMEKTVWIPADASDFTLQSALNDLWSIQPDTVQVIRTAENLQSYSYIITFMSTRGDFDLLNYEVFEGNNITLNIIEQTKGKPNLETFTLNWDGIASKPLSAWSSETEFQAAVEEMVSTKCPPQIAGVEEGFVVKYFRDYETDFDLELVNRGQKTAETDAYCGRYSLKNPAVLFDSADVKPNRPPYGDILLFPYNQFCLAYKGFLANYIGLKFWYQGNGKITRSTEAKFPYMFVYGNSWTYTCIDLLDLIQTKYAGTDFFLQRISLQRASESQSFYVDAVYIGQTPTISTLNDLPKRRLPALANKGIFLKHFQVNQTKVNGSTITNQYSVTMTSYNCSCNIPMMAVSFGKIIANETKNESVYRANNWPGESKIRIQRIQEASPPISGSFDIQAYGHILKGLPAAVSATDLQFALQSLEAMGQVSVTREGTCAGYSWNIKWKSACGKQNLLQINDSNIIGEKANMTVTKIKEGGLFRQRILGDLLRTPSQQPQVEVYVNGIPAKCSGDCGFTWDPRKTPLVLATSPSQGSYHENTILTIVGSGFSPASAISVSVGSEDCTLLSVDGNEIKCQILNGSAGHVPVAVSMADVGLAQNVEGERVHFLYQSQISHTWPASGSLAGGTLLTISGFGFNEQSKVLVGNETCNVIEGDLNKITCRTPKRTEGTVDISVITNGFEATVKDAFSYSCLQTPVMTDFSPKVRTILGEVNLTIKGYNFGNEQTQNVVVHVGGKTCQVLCWNFTDIKCLLPNLSPGKHDIYVEVRNWGFASTRDKLNASIEYILEVTSMFPQKGSLYGGTEITLTGFGFSTIPTENTVLLGSFPCSVVSSSENVIKCILHSTGNVFKVTNNGEDSVHGLGYAWSPAVLNVSVGDTVIWHWQAQPFLRGIGFRVFSVSSPGSVIYDGKGFTNRRQKSTSGSFSYQFTSPGIHYYSSGYVDEAHSTFLQGVINVSPAETRHIPLHLFVGSIEATYAQGGPENLHLGSSVASCLATEPVCGPHNSRAKNSNRFLFELSTCFSPSISNITPSAGTVNELITIIGHGFSNLTCANKITIGSYPCVVEESSDNSITCHIDPQNSMDVGIREVVTLTVYNLGIAISTLSDEFDRRFVLLPHIAKVLPSAGSTTGMTRVIIEGSGFAVSPAGVQVLMGHFPCKVLSVNYTAIECETSPAPQQLVAVDLLIHGVPAQCQGNCSFSYLESIAPCVTDVFPNSIKGSGKVLIEGEGFGSILEEIAVFIGNQQLRAIDVNENNITVLVTPLPAGLHSLSVVVGTKGLARGNLAVNSPAVASVSPASGSIGGGTTLVITGNGFYPGTTTVTVGDNPCQIISVNSSNVYCHTSAGAAGMVVVKIFVNTIAYPPLSFTYALEDTPFLRGIVPNRGPPGTEVEITGSNFGTDIMEIVVMINNAQCALILVNDSAMRCIVGEHAGGTFPVMMHRKTKGSAVSTVVFEYPLNIQNIHPSQGSFGGGQIMTVTGTGFNPQNSIILLCGSECAIDRNRSDYTTLLCEIPPSNGKGPEQACEVSVVNGKDLSQSTTPFTYTMSLTPLIFEISPKRGSTAGGTRLTVMGSGFSENMEDIQVAIAEAKCDVEYSNKTHIICMTSAHTPSGWAPLHVHVSRIGRAKDNVDFLYVDAWSSNFSWGGRSPPEEGSLAVITKGQTILLDQSTPILKMLLIQGGTLIFDEANIELQAENILITDGGILQIGTEASPFQHKAIITLHGHLRSPELPVYGAKTLAVREGLLDLHGLPVPVVWTHLAHTAKAGERTLILQEAVTWKAGDSIVIASTGHRHSQKENEKRIIVSVSADGKNVTLTKPLNYTHLGVTVTLPDGTLFDARAEVGILTRNILIRGSDNVEWNNKIPACPDGFDTGEFATQTCLQGKFGEEIGSDQFGGCIMFHAPVPGINMVTGRIEYVEVFHAGQAFRLGRYPIHWHLLGDLQFKSYVRGCAIHQTYNRAVTIHNTHHLLVERNIIYDIKGGAFFIEDGIEHGNILQYNLAVFVQQSTSLLNDDVTPAAFWVTNPNNTIRHNAAAGGTHFGFWYRMNNHPDGPSYNRNICQKRVPLGEFFNNTVHSQGWFGLWIFEEYFPMQTGSCTSVVPMPAIFNSLTTWNCQKGAEWVNGGALQFHNFVMINNYEAGIETKRILAPYVGGWGETNGAVIKNAKIVGHLDELGMGSAFCTMKGLVLPFSEGLTVSSVHFMNFDRPKCVALGVTSITGICNERCGGWSAKFVDIQYFHTPNKAGFRWEHEMVLIDIDGSLTGHKGHTVIPHSSLLDPSHCTQQAEWSIGFPGSVCDASVSFHRLAFNKPSPVSLLEKDVVLSDSFGTSIIPFQKKRLTHTSGWMALIPNAKHINWYFKDVDHITNISYSSTFYGFKEEDYVIISHNFTQNPDIFNVIDMRNGSSKPLNWNTSKNGDWHLEANTSTLYYLVSGRSDFHQSLPISATLDPGVKDVIINFQAYCCILQDCFPVHPPSRKPIPRKRPATYNLWSNDSFWQSSHENNYSVPYPGANVVIPEGTWIVADTDMPPMERLIIWGVLELEDKYNMGSVESSYRKVILNATYISLQGGRLIGGWEDNPFKGELQIVLRGNHSTPDWALPEGPNQGAKVLGVFGELDLHGIPRSIYKTKLSETAAAGSKVLSLLDAVDWQEGEEIVITTTSYDLHQTEIRSIVKILHGNRIIILNESLSYTHFAERYQVPGTGQSYTLAADVGILSRNIKIVGEDYPGWSEESFGARILVGSFTENTMTFKGSARISNVEFYHSGQEGYRDSTDPRYAVTFLNLGQIRENGSSYLRGCAFHHGFSPAVGVFGTDGLDIDNNIIYFTVGEGIRIWGDANRVRGNLIALSVWPGTYQNRKDLSSTLWHAAIEVNRGTNTVLQNNVVAGFGRAGYRIDGEPCSTQSNPMEKWFDNEAHGGLYGIYMNQDGLPGCSLIQGFTIWTCWDYGIYFQITESVHIYNVTLVNNGMAIFSIIYLPAAVSHKISSKKVQVKDSLIVGSSPEFNCSDILTNDDPNIELTAAHRSPRPPSGGRSGICWPTFASAHNMAPRKPHAGIMSYNAINGLLDISGSTFVGFKNVCLGETNVIFITNPLNEDLQHPIHVKNVQLVDTTEKSKIFIHRPDISKVNPSDCVDMVCDAKRKSLLRDMDGSFLGNSGSVIPQAEYEWNGNRQLGIGDYRIPKVMLTFLNGSRIPVSEKAPYKGIIRDSTCKYIPEWQSYQCFGMEYAMMVIESLDSDTETRRLSPVAVVSNGYVDLINGPQDHGWCAGYTCQRRLSLFHSIVALNTSYEVYFTGTSPQNLRLMLLNVDHNKAVLVGIFFSTLQRLDVYVNNSLVCPKNTVWNTHQKFCELNGHPYTGISSEKFLPNLDSTVFGENYFDRTYQMLYILVKGTTPVEIHTATVIFVSFRLPAVTEDDFYSSHNLVRNLVLFLKIPNDKIRISKIVRRESLRRKRSMDLIMELEIGDPPSQFFNSNTTGQMQLSELQEIADSLGQAVILGKTSSIFGFNISSMSITNPIPSTSDADWIKVTAQPVERSAFPVHHVALVSSLSVVTQPMATQPGQPFSQQPSVKAVDSDGNCISIGITSLTLKALLKDSSNNQISGLSGNTTIPFDSCWANYTDLIPLRTGKNFKIEFILDNVVRAESRTFNLPAQSVSSSSSGSSSSGSSSSGSSSNKAPTVGASTQTVTLVISCLIGRMLLLEIRMTAVFILNVAIGSY